MTDLDSRAGIKAGALTDASTVCACIIAGIVMLACAL